MNRSISTAPNVIPILPLAPVNVVTVHQLLHLLSACPTYVTTIPQERLPLLLHRQEVPCWKVLYVLVRLVLQDNLLQRDLACRNKDVTVKDHRLTPDVLRTLTFHLVNLGKQMYTKTKIHGVNIERELEVYLYRTGMTNRLWQRKEGATDSGVSV